MHCLQKKSVILLIVALMTLQLMGCNSSSNQLEESTYIEDIDAESTEYNETNVITMTIGDIFNSQERQIWYTLYDSIDKNGELEEVYLIEDGQITVYSQFVNNLSIQDVANYDDDSIIDYLNNYVAEKIDSDPEYWEEYCKKYVTEPTYVSIIGHTDPTGNTVVSETINIGDEPTGTYGTSFDINSGNIYSGLVFDTYFVGFDISSPGKRNEYIITRDKGYSYILDSRDSSYLSSWD